MFWKCVFTSQKFFYGRSSAGDYSCNHSLFRNTIRNKLVASLSDNTGGRNTQQARCETLRQCGRSQYATGSLRDSQTMLRDSQKTREVTIRNKLVAKLFRQRGRTQGKKTQQARYETIRQRGRSQGKTTRKVSADATHMSPFGLMKCIWNH